MDTQVPVYRATVETDVYSEWHRTPCWVLCTAVKTSLWISIGNTNHMEMDVLCLQHLLSVLTLSVVGDSLVLKVVPLDPSASAVLTNVKFLSKRVLQEKARKEVINLKRKIADVSKNLEFRSRAFIYRLPRTSRSSNVLSFYLYSLEWA